MAKKMKKIVRREYTKTDIKELRAHLITIGTQKSSAVNPAKKEEAGSTAVSIKNIPPSLTVKSLQA